MIFVIYFGITPRDSQECKESDSKKVNCFVGFFFNFFLKHCCCRMGYDLERFVGYVNEGLLCCVCRDVLERPLQAPCEHAFCSSCISSWLVYHRSCPEDRLPLDVSSLKPLYRSVHLYLSVLFTCDFLLDSFLQMCSYF